MSSSPSKSNNDNIIRTVGVDIIIPIYNASATIEETISSALTQRYLSPAHDHLPNLSINICCYDDASTDNSVEIVQGMMLKDFNNTNDTTSNGRIVFQILLEKGSVSRGAGYARNRAVECSNSDWLCLLDSDDVMRPTRVAEQLDYMLHKLNCPQDQFCTLLGCDFERTPQNSTWHYTSWANALDNERLIMEQFREITVIQPTWFMHRKRFIELGGYVEAPLITDETEMSKVRSSILFDASSLTMLPSPKQQQSSSSHHHQQQQQHTTAYAANNINNDSKDNCVYRLVRTEDETFFSLRVAEDLRFFHSHLAHDGKIRRVDGLKGPLVVYRHRDGMSQSSQTPRKLLIKLRAKAFEDRIIRPSKHLWQKNGFAVWGAGRDGKDFLKSLSPDIAKLVKCFADVDQKKINSKYYVNSQLNVKIPIVHFTKLAAIDEDKNNDGVVDPGSNAVDHYDYNTTTEEYYAGDKKIPRRKRRRRNTHDDELGIPRTILSKLPVVVCVAMYRTNGALEKNVKSIKRLHEGKNLWHFI